MTEQQYNTMADKIRNTRFGVKLIQIMGKLITELTLVSYPVLLIHLFFVDRSYLYQAILVPAVSFLVVSIFRSIYHSKRPYEEMNIEPITPKDTVGKSFPSRHVFSIFMIAMTFLQVSIPLAVILMIAGAFLAILRVIGGVHYTQDVLAGATIGILCGVIGYYVIF